MFFAVCSAFPVQSLFGYISHQKPFPLLEQTCLLIPASDEQTNATGLLENRHLCSLHGGTVQFRQKRGNSVFSRTVLMICCNTYLISCFQKAYYILESVPADHHEVVRFTVPASVQGMRYKCLLFNFEVGQKRLWFYAVLRPRSHRTRSTLQHTHANYGTHCSHRLQAASKGLHTNLCANLLMRPV